MRKEKGLDTYERDGQSESDCDDDTLVKYGQASAGILLTLIRIILADVGR